MNTLFLSTAIIGVILSLLIPIKFKSKQGYILSAITLIYSLSLAFYTAFWTGSYQNLPYFFRYSIGFTFLFGPLFYGLLKGDQFLHRKMDVLHFLPFIVFTVWYTIASGIHILEGFQTTHLIVYAIVLVPMKGPLETTKYSFLGFVIAYTVYEIIYWSGELTPTRDYALVFLMSLSIYSLLIFTYINSELIPKRKKERANGGFNKHVLLTIEAHLKSDKSYLNPNLRLADLAIETGFSTNQVSEAINSEYKSFNDMINSYRIEISRELLMNTNDKILAVALSSGFNNKVTFINAFKKRCNCTPSEFRNQLLTIKNDNPSGND